MARLLRRFAPFTSLGGAAWFAVRHRDPLWDWGSWTVRSLPRLAAGERGDLVTEARLRARLRSGERPGRGRVQVTVTDGRARLRGEVEADEREVVRHLASTTEGISDVEDELRVRGTRRRKRSRA